MEFKSFMVHDQQYGNLDGDQGVDERKPNKEEENKGIEYNFYS